MTEPTEQDRQNFALRKSIADRQQARYAEAEAHACSVFGPGWEPHGCHSIIENEEADAARREGRRPVAVAEVITACRGDEKRHFTVTDGVASECGPYSEAFAELLAEKHLTKPIYKHQIHWTGFEPGYEPRTAEQLAAAREKREQKAEQKWQEAVDKEAAGSLFPDFIREQAEEQRKKGRKR